MQFQKESKHKRLTVGKRVDKKKKKIIQVKIQGFAAEMVEL